MADFGEKTAVEKYREALAQRLDPAKAFTTDDLGRAIVERFSGLDLIEVATWALAQAETAWPEDPDSATHHYLRAQTLAALATAKILQD